MNTADLKDLLEPVRTLARDAGQAILEIAAGMSDSDVREKADGSPVTRADMASNDTIVPALERLMPDVPVISEEGDLSDVGGDAAHHWLVDPLDGTKEFIHGLPDYTVNIALVQGERPILGVIHVPARDSLYFAGAGLGAYRQKGEGEPEALVPNAGPRDAVAVVSRSHLDDRTRRLLDDLGIATFVQRGSSVKICAVAEGEADFYPRLGPTFLWDTAAGAAIAREAGCLVVDPAGRDLTYGLRQDLRHAGFLVYPASNRVLVDKLENISLPA